MLRIMNCVTVLFYAANVERSNLYLKLFKLVFGSVSLLANENEQMLKVTAIVITCCYLVDIVGCRWRMWFSSNGQSRICLEKVLWILTHSNWKRILVKTERQGIRYLCEELPNAWQWDLAYESRAWIEAESHWNEYDQMDVWG